MSIKFDNTAITRKNKESIKEQKKTEHKTSSEKKETKPRDDGTYTYRPFEAFIKGSNSTKQVCHKQFPINTMNARLSVEHSFIYYIWDNRTLFEGEQE